MEFGQERRAGGEERGYVRAVSGKVEGLIYWAGYAVFLIAGVALSLLHVLPVVNTAIFLLSLMWRWMPTLTLGGAMGGRRSLSFPQRLSVWGRRGGLSPLHHGPIRRSRWR